MGSVSGCAGIVEKENPEHCRGLSFFGGIVTPVGFYRLILMVEMNEP